MQGSGLGDDRTTALPPSGMDQTQVLHGQQVINPMPMRHEQQVPAQYPQQNAPHPAQYQQLAQPGIQITGQKNMTGLWIFLSLVALGPCGLLCLGFALLSVLPFVMVAGGLACGFVGLLNYRRFVGHPGWESQASKGLAMCVGGFAAAACGAVWIFVAWFQDQPSQETPSNEPLPVEDSRGVPPLDEL